MYILIYIYMYIYMIGRTNTVRCEVTTRSGRERLVGPYYTYPTLPCHAMPCFFPVGERYVPIPSMYTSIRTLHPGDTAAYTKVFGMYMCEFFLTMHAREMRQGGVSQLFDVDRSNSVCIHSSIHSLLHLSISPSICVPTTTPSSHQSMRLPS